jgi:hypothetical protein
MSSDAADPSVPPPADPVQPVLVQASASELKAMMRHWRRGRATRNLWEAFHDAYIVVIGALMIGAMVVNVVLKAQRVVALCSSGTCLTARALLPLAAFAVALAAALAISRLFGPVLASAAEGFWLLDTPVPRSQLLRVRLLGAIAAAFAGGAVMGALVSALSGSGWSAVVVWAIASGTGGAAGVAFAAAEQGRERHGLVRGLSYLFGTAAVVALVVVVGVAASWISLAWPQDRGLAVGLIISVLAAVLGAWFSVLAALRLKRLRRARLLSGGALVSGISGAFFALDVGLAHDILVARRALEIGQVRPVRGRGLGLSALTWREWQRLRRFPAPLLAVAGTVVVPYASQALGMGALAPLFAALALFVSLIPLLGGLRVLTRSGGMARAMPFSLSQLKLASITVPAIIVGIWAAATFPAFSGLQDGAERLSLVDAGLMAVVTGAAGLLGAVRWTQAKGVDFGAPMIATQAGAFPPGLMTNLFRGFDMCLLITAPMLLGFSTVWSAVLAAIVALVLLNSFDAESLRARQIEQQRLLDEQRRLRETRSGVTKQRKQ